MIRWIWRQYLKLFGWKTAVEFPYHHIRKFVIIVAPHTSNWDFIVGLGYRSILRLTDARYLGKAELFRPPFGGLFRSLGGIPVHRQSSHQLVREVAAMFEKTASFKLALAPEGTRAKVEKLRTGFYYIAKEASVPIVMAGIDWKNRTVVFSELLYPGDFDTDMKKILTFYRGIEGKYPANGLT